MIQIMDLRSATTSVYRKAFGCGHSVAGVSKERAWKSREQKKLFHKYENWLDFHSRMSYLCIT